MKTQLIILIQMLPFAIFAHDGAAHSHWYDNGSIGLALIMISVLLASIPLRYAHLIKKKEDKLVSTQNSQQVRKASNKFKVQELLQLNIARAHCDIPCKIYDPAVLQFSALSIIRFLDLINEMGDTVSKPGQFAELSRLVAQKEQHASELKAEIATIWGDYFKKPQIEEYPQIHDLVHLIMQDASKCKQSINRESAIKLLDNVNEFTRIFWATKGVATQKSVAPYPPELKIICPVLKSA